MISARTSARDSDSNLLAPKDSNQLGGDLVRGDSDPFEVSTRCDASDYGGQERLEGGAVRAGQIAKLHATVVQKVADVANKLGAGESTESPRRAHRTRRSTIEFDDIQAAQRFSYRRVQVRAGTQLDANRPSTNRRSISTLVANFLV